MAHVINTIVGRKLLRQPAKARAKIVGWGGVLRVASQASTTEFVAQSMPLDSISVHPPKKQSKSLKLGGDSLHLQPMGKNDYKELDNLFREIGIEGDIVFILILYKYHLEYSLPISEQLSKWVDLYDLERYIKNPYSDKILKIIIDEDRYGDDLTLAYQYFLAKRYRDFSGKFFTPRSFIGSLIKAINIKPYSKIYDPTCGGGSFLVETVIQNPYSNLCIIGNEIDPLLVELTSTRLNLLLGEFTNQIYSRNIFDESPAIRNHINDIDIIVANPPFSLKIDHLPISSQLYDLGYRNSDVLFIDVCFDLLKEGGRLFCLLPHSIISNKEYKNFRKISGEKWNILSVVTLPEGLFQENANTTTKADLIVLEKPRLQSVNDHKAVFANIASTNQSDLESILLSQQFQTVLKH